LRKWIVLATLTRTAEDKPSELIRHSLVRARFCESVARLAARSLEQSAFLTGLFSLLDALIDRPLNETLSEMGLAPEIAAVLRGSAAEGDTLARVFQLARAYEVADWQRVEEICQQLGVPVASLGEVYCAAAGWAQQVMEPVAAAQPV
jgi:EAL and modified HD-GYP domain-containing signal transduction protein